MKKIIVIFLTIFIFSISHAEVEVPGFAFTGKEISDFSIRPSFKNISVSFNVKSDFDTYLRQEGFRLETGETKDYKSEDPGGIYSGGIGTSLSSVFVGDRAYRNNIVKAYLDHKYLDVIKSYNKYYEKKIKGTSFEEEVRLVYSFAMMETGSISQSLDILKNTARNGKGYRTVAADRVAEYMLNMKAYEEMDIFSGSLESQTPYTLYGWLYSLLNLKRFDRLVKTFDANKDIISQDGRFYDFYITARYSQGGFDDVIKDADRSTPNTVGLVADAYLVKGDRASADGLISGMEQGSVKRVLMAKSAVLKGDLVRAGELLSELDNDEDMLNLFYYYIGKSYPKMNLEFLSQFNFKSRINADYLKFYTGVYYLASGDSKTAIRYLDAVIFNTELSELAYYYRGLAYSTLDLNRAERYFLKYIENSSDEEKINVSKYMLAQMKYIAGAYDDALMLLTTCKTDYCKVLKSRIFLAKEKYELAWVNVDNVKGDDAALIRATVLFHKKKYGDALDYLKLIKHKGRDSDYLAMLCWLKLGNFYEAGTIFRNYNKDEEFISSYLEHLFLNGQYSQVLKLTDGKAEYSLIRAKSLFSLGKLTDAAKLYNVIIRNGQNSFDAWNGLLSTYTAMNDGAKFEETSRRITEVKENFDKKDFLVYQTAVQALELKNTKLATVLLNYFFDSFFTSAYKNDAYLLRGKLFRDTGRITQCLNDAEVMLSEGKSDDALFLKAECLQTTKPKQALAIFEDMTKNSGRFRDLSYSKLIDLYSTPADILRAVNYFKGQDTVRYYSGLDRYLATLDKKELAENRALLDEMIADKNPAGLAAAYFYIGVISYNEGKYEEAAIQFMKSHYLFPTSEYSAKSLKMTIEAYKKMGRNDDIPVLEKKLKAMKR
ncbi:hypothetical protein Dacet_1101 [Denitrovibrio acetiphilus DSM 12809]|uniref:Uncharacterized protein n=1 Tax=Denitrovibrio acetiphilus (strain DSM 12809 / NBRC 114555 / N2460) TaxID=522772 RepID=D4H774_DENA2|nr:tetratricopeptide repeat protein [Denitrovibrio acetiphilus]ADD67873.1 hypothetical protein Dacet_1101 [Denitrovibrio acetiphilus DSM 12809]